MRLSMRPYQSEQDFWDIRNFLREVCVLNHLRMFCWSVARLDYWRWHGIMNLGEGTLETGVYLWETENRKIAGVVNQEDDGQVFLQIHPAYKTAAMEEEMIALAEEKLRAGSRRGGHALWIWMDSGASQRQTILAKRGYTHISEHDEHQWRRDLYMAIPDNPLMDGYTLRALGEVSELASRSWASWRAFHPDEPDEKYDTDWSWYQNIQKAPLYRRDLDLVAIAPSSEVAAFTTIWYDDVIRCGYFEPVGCMPEHQRRGLASSLLCEGMRRLKTMGAVQAQTAGGTPHANGLYQSVLGPVYDISQPWEKRCL